MTDISDLLDDQEQFDKRDGAARIARAACGTFPIFEQSVAWFTMIRAIKMAQEEVLDQHGAALLELDEAYDTIARLEAEIAELKAQIQSPMKSAIRARLRAIQEET